MTGKKIAVSGRVTLRAYDEHGELIFEDVGENLVVNTGLNHIADQMSDQGEAQMSHCAVGIDDTAPEAGQTELGEETYRETLDSVVQSTNSVDYTTEFGPGEGTGNLRETGIFNASSGGVMLARYTFTYNKGAGDTLVVAWKITFTAG